MKVVLISRGDARSGGAGRVAEQLAVGLTNRGYQITHFVRQKPRGEYNSISKLIQGIKGTYSFATSLRSISAGFDCLHRGSFGGLTWFTSTIMWLLTVLWLGYWSAGKFQSF